MRSGRILIVLPLLAVALGAAMVVSTHVEMGHVRRDVRASFESHVESVARLVGESASEAATALDLIYVLAEDQLAAAVHQRLRHLGGGPAGDDGIVVWVVEGPEGFTGDWGGVPAEARATLVGETLEAEEGELVESEAARTLGLTCAHVSTRGGRRIACKSLAELSRLRRETGLGALLRHLVGSGIVYVAVQDETGLLATSPDAGPLSRWANDPFLEQARAAGGRPIYRMVDAAGGGHLFEGASAFALPDGTTAVLRVGMDAAALDDVERRLLSRERLLATLVAFLVALSIAITLLLAHFERRRQATQRILDEREEDSRHWQAIGQMAATVAHEVRNPLNTVKMIGQRLSREFTVGEADRADYDELVELLGREADRVERVVTEFLELGRPLVLELEPITVERAIEEAVAPLRLRAEREDKRLVVEAGCATEVRLDRRRFAQIVGNLASNALDAVAAGGRVAVRASISGEALEVVVEDDGPGMDAETLERVQRPFVSTKAHGTGLGLPLARRLTSAHHGELVLESSPGGGTRARLHLPPIASGGRKVA